LFSCDARRPYVVSRPSEDAFNTVLKYFLPRSSYIRRHAGRTIVTGRMRAKRFAKDPKRARQLLIDLVKVEIGPDCNIKHFTPDDWPGQQRICRMPDGDLLNAIRTSKVKVVTDHIERFDASASQLRSGQHSTPKFSSPPLVLSWRRLAA
jgi:monooxygenase